MLKLAIYVAFFFMLLIFYGLPIHIIRDLFMTTRDFFKRLRALLRYRKAIQEMNRFPDANEEDLSRENTCIICREDMRPWDPDNNPGAVDRIRPKKLPCGHILHLGCLKSWLERQQVCPTCRNPVTSATNRVQANRGGALRIQLGGAQNLQPQPNNHDANNNNNAQGQAQRPQPPGQQRNNGPRIFNFGPFRLGLADNQQEFNQLMQGAEAQNAANNAQTPTSAPHIPEPTQQLANNDELASASAFLEQSIQAVSREYSTLVNTTQQIQTVQLLLAELHRLRQQQQRQQGEGNQFQPGVFPQAGVAPQASPLNIPGLQLNNNLQPQLPTHLAFPHNPMMPISGLPPRMNSPVMSSRHAASGFSIPAGSPELPEGVTIPPGWSLMPLQRLEGGNQVAAQLSPQFPTGDTTQPSSSTHPPMSGANNARSSRPPPSDSGSSDAALLESRANRLAEQASRATNLESAPVVAPDPVLPNWGGAAQLFSTRTQEDQAAPQFGASQRTPAAQHDQHPAPRESSSSEESGSDVETSEDEPSTISKGKARAVTVEEADTSEEESD